MTAPNRLTYRDIEQMQKLLKLQKTELILAYLITMNGGAFSNYELRRFAEAGGFDNRAIRLLAKEKLSRAGGALEREHGVRIIRTAGTVYTMPPRVAEAYSLIFSGLKQLKTCLETAKISDAKILVEGGQNPRRSLYKG